MAEGYRIPGQFIQIKVGDSKPGFYAIASPPDPDRGGCIELLIKSMPGTTAEILVASTAGTATLYSITYCSAARIFIYHIYPHVLFYHIFFAACAAERIRLWILNP